MLNRVFQKRLSMLKKTMRLKSEVAVQMNSQQPALHETSQFSKSRLVDFGELPVGEIPVELKTSPQSNHTTLNNNARVVTEVYPNDHASVSLFMKAGSRYEKVETSGAARMLCNLFLRGSSQKNRTEMEKALSQLGASVEVTCEREIIGVTLTVGKEDVSNAINLLGEMVLDTHITQQSVDAEKDNVRDMAREVSRDQHMFTIEGLFYTSFRDHMVGQPVYGNRDTAHDLTAEVIQEHRDKTFSGDNVVLVASGNVSHEQVVAGASQWLDKLPQQPKTKDDSIHYTPHLTPTMMSQTDHEMHNLNVGVGFFAPGFNNPDHVAMKFFEEVVSDYNANHDGMANVNSPERQYNSLHKHFGHCPGINVQKTKFYSFGDFGLFTSWVHGNEIFGRKMMYLFPYICGWYAKHLNQTETFRARARLFNKLLEQKASPKLNLQIAENSLNFGRRVSRTEMAYRFSNIGEHQHLRQVARKWFFDQDVCAHTFGNTHRISGFDHYHRGLTMSSRADINAIM